MWKSKFWKIMLFPFIYFNMFAKILFLIFGLSTFKIHKILIGKHVLMIIIWHCLRICIELSKHLKNFAFWLGISNDLLVKVEKFSFHKLIHKGPFHWIRSILIQIVLHWRFRKWPCNQKYQFSKPQNLKSKRRVCDWGPCRNIRFSTLRCDQI